jgi:hypothetical protein
MDPDPAPAGGDPAGGDPKPGAFDPVTFKADLLGEFRKDLNGALKGLKNDFMKLVQPKPAEPPAPGGGDPPPPVAGDPPPGGKTPAENALALELKNYRVASEARIKALETANLETAQKAEKTDRESKVRSELGKYKYADDNARETAFRIFSGDVQRAEDGSLVANELPYDKYIETELASKHPYLLAPKDTGSAGARGGKSPGGKKWDLDRDLKPENFSKLTPQEQAELRQTIANAL